MSEITEPEAPAKFTATHVRELLSRRYCAPEWALMEEVAPATGGGTRYADAVAVNLWKSRGHAVHGFEIKVSRSDWLRELKDPAKADPMLRYCDHWWIVAPRGIVKDGELPPTWGLLEVRSNSLVADVNAPMLEAEPLTRAFFASLMRRGHESLEEVAKRRYAVALQEARAAAKVSVEERVKSSTREHEKLLQKLEAFKAETGLDFTNWRGPRIETIKLAQVLEGLSYGVGGRPLQQLTNMADRLQDAAETVRGAVAECGIQADDRDAV